LPIVDAVRGLEYVGASDEHGVLRVDPGVSSTAIGERVWLIPGHCDPTVNLYDWIVGVRGDVVECVWPIAARGALG
jgi:D-serine deaminase-like pyridoxal phosphate-dependent protein